MRKFDMTIIRPMCLIHESDLLELAEIRNYKKAGEELSNESGSSRSDMKGF